MSNNVAEQSLSDTKSTVPSEATPISSSRMNAGFIAPILGRKALRDVNGYFNFSLIKQGETITKAHVDRAQSLGRLYELIACTEIL
jgi:hypothetical protein